ncbi:hypothetical protein ACFVRU_59145, partial [Streptomyces sp. NPDC057927]
MIALMLALGSSLAYGCADFLGGLGARKAHVLRTVMIAALLHSPYEHGGRVVRETSYMDLKHLISMQYYTAVGRTMALRDLLMG